MTSLNPLFQFPDVSVPPPAIGTPLPGTPKNSLALAFEYGQLQFAGGDWRFAVNAHYQSSVVPALSATVPTVPGFTMVDTRASYAVSHLVATVYVNNVTNHLGITSYSDPSIFGNRFRRWSRAAHRRSDARLFIQRMRESRVTCIAMIRTGSQYLDSIRDGREVYINGERVKDVTAIRASGR